MDGVAVTTWEELLTVYSRVCRIIPGDLRILDTLSKQNTVLFRAFYKLNFKSKSRRDVGGAIYPNVAWLC